MSRCTWEATVAVTVWACSLGVPGPSAASGLIRCALSRFCSAAATSYRLLLAVQTGGQAQSYPGGTGCACRDTGDPRTLVALLLATSLQKD